MVNIEASIDHHYFLPDSVAQRLGYVGYEAVLILGAIDLVNNEEYLDTFSMEKYLILIQ